MKFEKLPVRNLSPPRGNEVNTHPPKTRHGIRLYHRGSNFVGLSVINSHDHPAGEVAAAAAAEEAAAMDRTHTGELRRLDLRQRS